MFDPGICITPCSIGSLSIKNALVELSASINLMSYSCFLSRPRRVKDHTDVYSVSEQIH